MLLCSTPSAPAGLFVTLDRLGARHDLAQLTSAYAGAVALVAAGLEF
jgi:hypothetical protein